MERHFTVFHLDKQKAAGGGLTAHIDRRVWDAITHGYVPYIPKSAKNFRERGHLNKDYILRRGENRSAAIARRLDEAGITSKGKAGGAVTRKLRDDAVTAITLIAGSDYEKMTEIERSGRLDEWAAEVIAYCRRTFGEQNVVAAALHMDEETPHLHVTIVPVLTSQAKARKETPSENAARQGKPKRRYRKQQTTARLCAHDFMSRARMKDMQTTYAEAMARWGMVRGLEGSKARHVAPDIYNAHKAMMEEMREEKERVRQRLEEKGIALGDKAREEARLTAEIERKREEADKRVGLLAAIGDSFGVGQKAAIRRERDAAVAERDEAVAVRNVAEKERDTYAARLWQTEKESDEAARERDAILAVPLIRQIWDDVQRNIRLFMEQLRRWIEEGREALAEHWRLRLGRGMSDERHQKVAQGIVAASFLNGHDINTYGGADQAAEDFLSGVDWGGVSDMGQRSAVIDVKEIAEKIELSGEQVRRYEDGMRGLDTATLSVPHQESRGGGIGR